MKKLIQAVAVNFADLLREGYFRVPRHQRYYDWKKEQVTDLLNDLYDATMDEHPCHFLGSIMLIGQEGEKNQFEINDGQQRIVTFSMICAYFCKVLHDTGNSKGEANCLRILFDVPEGHDDTLDNAESLRPRVTPPRNDRINFHKLICGNEIGRNGKMTVAWDAIQSFFTKKKDFSPAQQNKMLEFMLNKTVVIRLEVDHSLDVNAVYEAMNYRGKSLSEVDLLKNYFLSFFANDRGALRYQSTSEKFEKISTAISANYIPGYVRCYIQVRHGFIRKEQFFRDTKNLFSGRREDKAKQVSSLVEGMASSHSLQIFRSIVRPSEGLDFLQKLTSDARKGKSKMRIASYLLDLQRYKITRPILFALLICYSESSITSRNGTALFAYVGIKLLASFVQRIAHVSNSFAPSVYEENFANLSKQIHDAKCHTAQTFFDAIKRMDKLGIIDDRHYTYLMNSKYMGKSSLAKSGHILRRIAELQDQKAVGDDGQISIEHILPKSKQSHAHAQTSWAHSFSQSECDRLVHSLGNLTLLSKHHDNPNAVSSASFAAKKQVYSASSFKMTKDICGYTDWTPDNVKDRQRELVKIATEQIWNFDFQ